MATVAPVRSTTSRVFQIGLHVLLVAVAIQLALAGAGAFGATAWRTHVMLGMLITVLAIVLAGMALVARPARALVIGSTVVAVLAVLQPVLSVLARRTDPWFGVLHALGAGAMLVILVWLVVSARRA